MELVKSCRVSSNSFLSRQEPVKVLLITVFSTASVLWFYDLLHREESLKKRISRSFFKWVRMLPPVKKKIEEEMSKNLSTIENSFNNFNGVTLEYRHQLPSNGMSTSEVLNETNNYFSLEEVKWKEGYTSGTVYVCNQELDNLMTKVYSMFMWSNPLHPETFPDVRKMEAEVVRMCCTMYNGDQNSCGTMTSGGTESIMLAMKTYRDIAYDRGVRIPEMIVPVTAHAAFDKAADYFRIKIIHIKVDPVTYKVDMKAFKRAIGRNTCVLVGSSPNFPQGVIDPIEEIAKLGKRYSIPVHVDCCLGGFLVPFMKKAGYPLDEIFDFSLPGVTSISCDTHKYGFAPKGSSVIMYRSDELRKKQYFVQTDWPGGVYACPTFAGSRPGGIIATCWATLMHFGEAGYIKSTKEIIQTSMKIKDKISKIESLFVLGDPKLCVVSFGSSHINIYNLLDRMKMQGWQLNPLQYPYSLHIAVTEVHTHPGVSDKFLEDLEREVTHLLKLPRDNTEGSAAIYGMAQSLPDRSLVSDIATGFISACYNTKNSTSSNK